MCAAHTWVVEALLSLQTERVSAIAEPLMETVAATSGRAARLAGRQDELVVKVQELTKHVAELTIRLAGAGRIES